MTAAAVPHMAAPRPPVLPATPAFTPPGSWPRERRDTLFLLATLAFVLAPHAAYLPIWATAFAAFTLAWRGWLAWHSAPLPGTRIKTLLLVVVVAATLTGFRTIAGPEAGGTLLALLTALKTLELRARRDALVIFYLGFFLVLLSFFQSQSILVAAAMLVAVTLLLTALVNANMPAGRPPLKAALGIALRLMALGVPAMALLFVVFPRVGPLWGMPTTMARTGLSEDLQIGDINELALDDAIALRLRFDGPAPAQRDLYFRGPVLELFDGRTWRARDDFAPPGDIAVQGPGTGYEMTLEPSRRPWLVLLDVTPPDAPPLIDGDGRLRPRQRADLQWVANRPVNDLLRYRARAYTHYRAGAALDARRLAADTWLPAGSNPRTVAWARALDGRPDFRVLDARGKAAWLLAHIRDGGYRYTLSPTPYAPDNAADQLWFDHKEGFCEHYAAAFAVALRALGVPARIVTGYQGAERNPVDGYWVVRQSNAHAWVEIWQAGSGWLRVDPTAAIDPARIEGGAPAAAPAGFMGQTLGRMAPSFFTQMRLRWDALENGWNQWVISYSQTRQFDLLRALGLSGADWTTLARSIALVVAAVALAAALVLRWRAPRPDPWLATYALLRDKLERAGVRADAATGPRTLARRAERLAEGAPAMHAAARLLLRLERWRYAHGQDAGELAAIARAARRLRLS